MYYHLKVKTLHKYRKFYETKIYLRQKINLQNIHDHRIYIFNDQT